MLTVHEAGKVDVGYDGSSVGLLLSVKEHGLKKMAVKRRKKKKKKKVKGEEDQDVLGRSVLQQSLYSRGLCTRYSRKLCSFVGGTPSASRASG